MTTSIGIIITIVLMLPGIAGVFLPVVPGVPYMFVVAAVYGLVTGFNGLSLTDVGWLGAIAAVSVLIDYLAGMLGAKYAGAGKKTILVGLLSLIIGTVLIPPFGGIVFMFIGILLSELWIYGKKQPVATKTAAASVITSIWGILINLMLAVGFIVLFTLLSIN